MKTIERIRPVIFVVKSGNWKLSISVDIDVNDKIDEYHYIEACTRAIEFFYGSKEPDDSYELINLYDDDGVDSINDDEYEKNDLPEPSFGVFLASYIECDENKQNKWKIFQCSMIFANASQHDSVIEAEEFEKKWQKQMKNMTDKKNNKKPKTNYKKRKKKS